jgi:exo-beta-1,3-glucanase (GH17 family)
LTKTDKHPVIILGKSSETLNRNHETGKILTKKIETVRQPITIPGKSSGTLTRSGKPASPDEENESEIDSDLEILDSPSSSSVYTSSSKKVRLG